jgi:hypothetical protein
MVNRLLSALVTVVIWKISHTRHGVQECFRRNVPLPAQLSAVPNGTRSAVAALRWITQMLAMRRYTRGTQAVSRMKKAAVDGEPGRGKNRNIMFP